MIKLKLYLFLVLLSFDLYSQSIVISNIDDSNFPEMTADFIIYDEDGQRITNFSPSEFNITESSIYNTITGEIIDISCPPIEDKNAISSVLSIDISRSMTNGFDRLQIAKNAATFWVNSLNLNKSECAVTSFDNKNYLNQDFSQDDQALINGINSLDVINSTDFDNAFLGKPAGSLIVSDRGKHQPVIIFLTDAYTGAGNNGVQKQNEITTLALQQNCAINVITMGNNTNSSLAQIAKDTGGSWFDNVNSEEEMKEIYKSLLSKYLDDTPCKIKWISEYACKKTDYQIKIEYFPLSISSSTFLTYKNEQTEQILIEPSFIKFGGVEPQTSKELSTTITAVNNDLIVSNINTSNQLFTINPKNFIVLQGESIELNITYSPQDSTPNYATFSLLTQKCDLEIFASGGYAGVRSEKSSIKVLHPNGGEKFLIGSDTIITWDGIPKSELTNILFSPDNGNSWQTLTNQGENLLFDWNKLPNFESDDCLIKIESTIKKDNLKFGELISTFTAQDSRSIEFSPTKNEIATGRFDGYIHILDPQGNIIENFEAFPDFDNVYTISYNEDGTLLASSSEKSVKIWDTNTWVLIKSFPSFHFYTRFNPEGKILAVTNNTDDLIQVYDVNNWNILFADNVVSYVLGFSTDNKFLATDDMDDLQIKIYNTDDWSTHKLIPKLNYRIDAIEFSPFGNYMAVGYFGGTIEIYSTLSWNLIKTLNIHSHDISSLKFSPDGYYLVSSSKDQSIIITELSTWNQLATLSGHSKYINDLDISPTGDRIISCSEDLTLKLWNLRNVIIDQTDVSDNVFSLVKPIIISKNVDMGLQYINQSNEEVIPQFIENNSIDKVRIDSIKIINDPEQNFSLVSNTNNIYIEKNNSENIEFAFHPTTIGPKKADIEIFTQYQTLMQTIKGNAIEAEFELVSDYIDFGEVYLWSNKDSLCPLITNIGSSDIVITGIEVSGLNGEDFIELSNFSSTFLRINDTLKLPIRFTPRTIGGISGIAKIYYEPNPTPIIVPLYGIGIKPNRYAIFSLDTIEVNTGEEFRVNLKLIEHLGLKDTTNYNVFSKMTYNPTVIVSKDIKPEVVQNTIKLNRNFTFNKQVIKYQTSIDFIAALGNDSTTVLKMNVDSTTQDLPVFINNGLVKIKNLCYEGGTRLINNTQLAGINITVNTDNYIELEIIHIEDGRLSLNLFNSIGQNSHLFSNKYFKKGKYNFTLNKKNFPSGKYFIILKSPTITDIKKILIQK